MIALAVIVAHLVGDYVLQNSWMAARKTSSWPVALFHGWIQGVLLMAVLFSFYGFTHEWRIPLIFFVTALTHAAIDRYRLVKPIIWALNQIAPYWSRYPWLEAKANNGHPAKTPAWMSTWLMIVADNSLHLLITVILLGVLL